MKKLIMIAAAAATLMTSSCGQKQAGAAATDNDTVPTDSILIQKLQKLQANNQVAFGHHDDPAYGRRWEYQPDSSDVKNVVGDYPAVFDWDLGLIEWNTEKQLDGVPFEFIRTTIKSHDAQGGINTISWHPRNPITKGDAWDVSAGDVLAELLKEGEMNDTIRAWIGNTADFIGSLTNDEGKRIPVVFRPWHEHTGGWFWWGATHCTPEEYKALWKLTREVFDEKGIDNVVWAYSPDQTGTPDKEKYLERYPGDEYIDIVGGDIYDFTTDPTDSTFVNSVRRMLTIANEVAQERGKVLALTETGNEGLRYNDWYTSKLVPAIEGFPIAYLVVWRNSMPTEKQPNHFYAPYKGHPAEADFIEFAKMPRNVFLKDLKQE